MDRETPVNPGADFALLWEGMNGSPERREQFLKECWRQARAEVCLALSTARRQVPGKAPKQVYDETVPALLERVARQAEGWGFDADQTAAIIDAYRVGCRSIADQFGF